MTADRLLLDDSISPRAHISLSTTRSDPISAAHVLCILTKL